MDKFLATFSLTYKNKVKTKSFMIFTGLVIVLMLLASNMNKIIDLFDDGPDKVGVVSSDNEIYKVIKSQGDQLDEGATFKKVSEKQAKTQVQNEKLDKAYIIKMTDDNKLSGKILSKDTVSEQQKQKLKASLSTIQTQLVAANLNLSQGELKQLQSQSKVTSEVIADKASNSNLSEAQKGFNTIMVYAGLMLIFFIVFNYASQVAMEIATEKTSRVIEMIITSVSPVTHILAKISGVIAVAFTQIIIFVAAGLICFFVFDISDMLKGFKIEPNELTMQISIVGIVSLIIGILSYIILAAILGSITARIEDINQALMPMTLFSMIAFYISLFSVMNPDTMLTKITSFIPLLSPFVMFVRSASPDVAVWEIVVSVILSIITIFILLWIAVRSYKNTILSFDKGFMNAMKRIFKRS
ncbi:ABC-2 type transport system permease protein [Staphylococcus saprophyticus]|jgi:ABC-2 type transport system permease protein|uniref:ABC-type Na+ efflux pump permease component n=1 Tax=Staphylococcus saprophyticus subsp. saprophyticus (strain ATCC 15305 / DSM 20229 / NCIMB 8711 / NCTC 7292 / S-41) TaxID=342451 RepID=Q49ZR4_STAS1|nr:MULTISPECIES: ABC transporter permease [Staphylococcus]CRV27322.1 membrane protein [Streptococcus equi subsp. equi]ASF19653.1 ABC transporter permease [Staphylococcus saprophyticus]MBC2919813.1 ABC transporter permease [Staphylococcus saprophyticus]MBC2957101.1 ABC transporter permease [Staphylococcus saprophyticus]MBC3008777.1 ABC transporter permease [Staphylococcus saprophyticus]